MSIRLQNHDVRSCQQHVIVKKGGHVIVCHVRVYTCQRCVYTTTSECSGGWTGHPGRGLVLSAMYTASAQPATQYAPRAVTSSLHLAVLASLSSLSFFSHSTAKAACMAGKSSSEFHESSIGDSCAWPPCTSACREVSSNTGTKSAQDKETRVGGPRGPFPARDRPRRLLRPQPSPGLSNPNALTLLLLSLGKMMSSSSSSSPS